MQFSMSACPSMRAAYDHNKCASARSPGSPSIKCNGKRKIECVAKRAPMTCQNKYPMAKYIHIETWATIQQRQSFSLPTINATKVALLRILAKALELITVCRLNSNQIQLQSAKSIALKIQCNLEANSRLIWTKFSVNVQCKSCCCSSGFVQRGHTTSFCWSQFCI